MQESSPLPTAARARPRESPAELGHDGGGGGPHGRGRALRTGAHRTTRWGTVAQPMRKALRVDGNDERRAGGHGAGASVRGRVGRRHAVRLPVRDVAVLPLDQLRRDPARRSVISCVADPRRDAASASRDPHVPHHPRIARPVPATGRPAAPPATTAAVLAGDMNLWGPPRQLLLPLRGAGPSPADLAGPTPSQPAGPRAGHAPSVGGGGPGGGPSPAPTTDRWWSGWLWPDSRLIKARCPTDRGNVWWAWPTPLTDFETPTFTNEGDTRTIYRIGSGPAVIVMSEIPGITPGVAEFGRRVAASG